MSAMLSSRPALRLTFEPLHTVSDYGDENPLLYDVRQARSIGHAELWTDAARHASTMAFLASSTSSPGARAALPSCPSASSTSFSRMAWRHGALL